MTADFAGTPHDLACERVVEQVYAFIDQELDTASADAIRVHLAACEPCMDRFDIEQAVKAIVRRCGGGDRAPERLRVRIRRSLVIVTQRSVEL